MRLKMYPKMRLSFSAFALKAFGSAFALFLVALSSVHAAGLGKLTVLSSLGQPLRAEIELTAVAKEDVGNIVVKLASHDDYRKANLAFTSVLNSLHFSVEQRGKRNFVRVTSGQALNEPFLGMLLEVRSVSGRLTREYTFLLDPADLRRSTPAVAASKRVRPVAPVVAQQPAETNKVVVTSKAHAAEKVAAAPARTRRAASSPEDIRARARALKAKADAADKSEPSKTVATKEKSASGKEASKYKVKKGDTLAGIAQKHKHDEVSLEQMLVSTYQANPEAFAGKNMNRLRVGRVLTIPDAEASAAVSSAEARKVIVAQASDFSSYRSKLAAQAAQSAGKSDAAAVQTAGGKITAKVQEKSTPAQTSQDKLKLSKASIKPQGADKASSGMMSAEDKLAKEKQAAEARSRVKELEKNVNDLQGVIDLKNKQLAEQQKQADLQKQAELQKQADLQKQAAQDAAAKAAAAKTAASAPPVASVPPLASASASVPPVAASVPVKKPTVVKKKYVPPPPPPPSFLDEMLDNPIMLGGVGVALLLIVLLLARSRSKKKPHSAVGGSLVSETRDSPNSLFGSSGGQSVDTNNSIFNSGFTPSASLLDANEVDPVAEADVYIAYGREAQAVEILKEALRSHPERNALRVKLLEIYASQKDVNAFDIMAGELYGLTRGEGEEWVYVAGLGIAIDPNNPLYAGGDLSDELLDRPTSLQGSMTQPAPDLDPDVLLETPRMPETASAALPESARPSRDQIENPDFPLDLGVSVSTQETSAPLVFELSEQNPPVVEAAVTDAATAEPAALDFDLNLPPLELESPSSDQALAPESNEPAPLDFDLGLNDAKKEELPSSEGVTVSEISDSEYAQMDEFKSAKVADDDMDFEVQMAAADRELAAIAPVEPYAPAPAAEVPAAEASKPAVTPIEFDFGAINLDLAPTAATTEEPKAEPMVEAATAAIPPAELAPVADRAGSVEMDTKIELAAAYLGIGDKEGARELLEEVMQEGSPEQVQKAKEALNKIS